MEEDIHIRRTNKERNLFKLFRYSNNDTIFRT